MFFCKIFYFWCLAQFSDAGIWADIYIHASVAVLFAFLHHSCFTMTKTKSKLLLGDSPRQPPVGPFLEKKKTYNNYFSNVLVQ